MKGKLHLIPTVLAENTEGIMLPPVINSTVQGLHHFLCENVRTARRFVSRLKVHSSVESLDFLLLDKDTVEDQLPTLMSPLLRGIDMGLLSESGCPAVADPGAAAVKFAHQNDITVVPLPGPSSLLLALMASGLNGQQFAFHGYLPVDSVDAGNVIRRLERESAEKRQTQLFIETPYRNSKLLNLLLKSLQEETRLCVAVNLTSANETIKCMTVGEWKKQVYSMEKAPATFLFQAVGK